MAGSGQQWHKVDGIAPDIMDSFLVDLCRFLIKAEEDVRRGKAPRRTAETQPTT